jgi:predicted GTPase
MVSAIPQEPMLVIIGSTGTGKSKVNALCPICRIVYLLLQPAGG